MTSLKTLLLSVLGLGTALHATQLSQVLDQHQIQGQAHLSQELAHYRGTPVKLAFTMQGCGACKALKASTQNPRGVILSIEPTAANEAILNTYGVQKFPTVIVIDGSGNSKTSVGSVEARTALES